MQSHQASINATFQTSLFVDNLSMTTLFLGGQMKGWSGGMLALSLSFLLAACSARPVISGKVVDNFGHPLAGVEVSIVNSNFKAQTDASGGYEIDYAPGSFTLQFDKDGHVQDSVPLNIATATAYPMNDIVLTEIPPGNSVFLVGKDQYLVLAPMHIREIIQSMGMNQTFDYPLVPLPGTKETFLKLQKELIALHGRKLQFADSSNGTFMPFISPNTRFLGHVVGGFTENNSTLRVATGTVERFANFTVYTMVDPPENWVNLSSPVCFTKTIRNMGGYIRPDANYLASCIGGVGP